jgi:hypothetical protein
MGVDDQHHTLAALPHYRGGWVGPRAGMEGCGEEEVSCPDRGLNPEPSSP